MKLKNVLLTSLSFVLVAAVTIGGTFAYLTSTDDDVNVMTLGNVKIEQIEYERVVNADGSYATKTIDGQTSYVLKDFTQAKPLLPSALVTNGSGWGWDTTLVDMSQVGSKGTMQVFNAGSNAQDKIVTVKNTGESDAYVRTWIALEDPFTENRLGVNVGKGSYYTQTSWTTVEIDGVKYSVSCFTYKEALKPGEVSTPSLFQVYLNSKATNEDMELLGDTYEILAFSQAVQTAGFDSADAALNTAFGANHPWADGVKAPVIVTNDAELKAAIDEGAEEIVLESGNYGVIDVTVNRNLTLSAAANADVKIAGIDGQSNNNRTNVTIKGVTIDNSLQTEGWYTGTAQKIKPCVGVWGGNYTFENCTFYVTGESGAETGVMSWWTTNKGVMNFTNCTFNGGNGSARGMQIYGNYDLNVTNCTFNTAKDYSIKYVGAEGCVATFKNNSVNATTNFVQTGSAPYAGANYTLVFEGNTLATRINHVYVDNAEGQTITINGEAKAATVGAIY